MGRNKFTQREIDIIGKLLKRKMAGTRFQQKMVRHTLRTTFEFNISDFNVQGKAFGPSDLQECVRRGVIRILDDATIEAMKLRHAEKKRHEEALRQAEEAAENDNFDWRKCRGNGMSIMPTILMNRQPQYRSSEVQTMLLAIMK